MKSKNIVNSAIASSVLFAALSSVSSVSVAAEKERCADIVKSGKNSCAVKTLGLSCQGSAGEDNLVGAWIKVPAGTCSNIVSICANSMESPEDTNEKKLAKACAKIAEQTDANVVGGRLVDENGEAI